MGRGVQGKMCVKMEKSGEICKINTKKCKIGVGLVGCTC